MRRLYSTFAGGWPGIGLTLMRVAVSVTLLVRAGAALLNNPPAQTAILSVILAGAGLLLIAGLFTPIVGMLMALIEIVRSLTVPADGLVCLLIATLGAALAMLGPGLWSVDARLFGWKRIEPSPRKR